MPRLAICSRDLHCQWINWAPLYDTMEVSMLRLTWLTVAQHVFQPALTCWQVGLSWFREKLSPANREQRLSRWADFAKNCLPLIGSKELPRFREKYCALGRQKMGSNMRPRYIQFRDIRDISGLHCIATFTSFFKSGVIGKSFATSILLLKDLSGQQSNMMFHHL